MYASGLLLKAGIKRNFVKKKKPFTISLIEFVHQRYSKKEKANKVSKSVIETGFVTWNQLAQSRFIL
jgi:ABC-type dipeptide/oligopeptide/nickel transport system ATPase component